MAQDEIIARLRSRGRVALHQGGLSGVVVVCPFAITPVVAIALHGGFEKLHRLLTHLVPGFVCNLLSNSPAARTKDPISSWAKPTTRPIIDDLLRVSKRGGGPYDSCNRGGTSYGGEPSRKSSAEDRLTSIKFPFTPASMFRRDEKPSARLLGRQHGRQNWPPT